MKKRIYILMIIVSIFIFCNTYISGSKTIEETLGTNYKEFKILYRWNSNNTYLIIYQQFQGEDISYALIKKDFFGRYEIEKNGIIGEINNVFKIKPYIYTEVMSHNDKIIFVVSKKESINKIKIITRESKVLYEGDTYNRGIYNISVGLLNETSEVPYKVIGIHNNKEIISQVIQ